MSFVEFPALNEWTGFGLTHGRQSDLGTAIRPLQSRRVAQIKVETTVLHQNGRLDSLFDTQIRERYIAPSRKRWDLVPGGLSMSQ